MFQHIASLANLDHVSSKTFSVAAIRAVLCVPEGKILRFANLKKDVIDPAIEEINKLSRLTLAVTLNKTGRTVSSVTITWIEKEDPAPVKRELAVAAAKTASKKPINSEKTPKISKKLPASEFPSSGPIRYAIWGKKVRENAPLPTPDPDVVADQFRKWAAGKGIPLNSPNIEDVFIGFCKKFKI